MLRAPAASKRNGNVLVFLHFCMHVDGHGIVWHEHDSRVMAALSVQEGFYI